MASLTSPFPSLKTTGDDKHDMEVYIEDLVDSCVIQKHRGFAFDKRCSMWSQSRFMTYCYLWLTCQYIHCVKDNFLSHWLNGELSSSI